MIKNINLATLGIGLGGLACAAGIAKGTAETVTGIILVVLPFPELESPTTKDLGTSGKTLMHKGLTKISISIVAFGALSLLGLGILTEKAFHK